MTGTHPTNVTSSETRSGTSNEENSRFSMVQHNKERGHKDTEREIVLVHVFVSNSEEAFWSFEFGGKSTRSINEFL